MTDRAPSDNNAAIPVDVFNLGQQHAAAIEREILRYEVGEYRSLVLWLRGLSKSQSERVESYFPDDAESQRGLRDLQRAIEERQNELAARTKEMRQAYTGPGD